MRKLFLWLLALSVTGVSTLNPVFGEEAFSFDMTENRLRIVIPDIPQISMTTHPLAESRADMRFMGADRTGYSVSILTPTADAGMGPEQCAGSSYKSLLTRYKLNPDHIVRRRVNKTTFIVLFPFRDGSVTQFKAYILSGYGGDHCVDVHVSKNVQADTKEQLKQQLAAWYSSFTKAVIAPY